MAAATVACGGDDTEDAERTRAAGAPADKAFLTAMVSHHESAIEMADIARTRAGDPFIERLAGAIRSTQQREITQMKEIYTRLFDGELRPDPKAHDGLGLTAEEAGMTHSAHTGDMLRSADPFDRAFVDEMVPHHEGAIRMADAVLKKTKDASLRRLAPRIASTQEREIEAMNDFRSRKFGGPVPPRTESRGRPEAESEHGAGHPD